MQQERAAVHSQIRSGAINTSHLHTVVRDYLVAHAYEDTLSHFDKSYSQRALPCLCDPEFPLCSFPLYLSFSLHSQLLSALEAAWT